MRVGEGLSHPEMALKWKGRLNVDLHLRADAFMAFDAARQIGLSVFDCALGKGLVSVPIVTR